MHIMDTSKEVSEVDRSKIIYTFIDKGSYLQLDNIIKFEDLQSVKNRC